MWVKFDDSLPENPDVDRLSHGAFRLYVSSICYCQKHLTDGAIDAGRVPLLIRSYRASYATELTACGLWVETESGYEVHNFTKWNKTRDYWKEEQRKAAERKAEWRAQSGRH
jgi:ribonuclease HI